MSFVWFWTFWHWSKEGFRTGSLLRGPIHGLGGHWDEWFQHEAAENDLAAIAKIGLSGASQRRFIAWLLSEWSHESGIRRDRATCYFVLAQLAAVEPFKEWAAFARFRDTYRARGVAAVILGEDSPGEPEDVRPLEAVALPDEPAGDPEVLAEGFHTGDTELNTPRLAAANLLHGPGLKNFLALWLAAGKRPYSTRMQALLATGWLAMGGIILYLIAGRDPGDALAPLTMALVASWVVLSAVGTATAVVQCAHAWQLGRVLRTQLEQSQIRLRLNGNLKIIGGSAGLPFCLNILSSICRSRSAASPPSWLWDRVRQGLRQVGNSWAATGGVTPQGSLKAVVLGPKLQACLKGGVIEHILIPHQPSSGGSDIVSAPAARKSIDITRATTAPATGQLRLGFAAEETRLQILRCRNVAQAVFRMAGLFSWPQLALNLFALAVSGAVLLAAPDLRGILRPAPPPGVVKTGSPTRDYLWVSLDTRRPNDFRVVFQSGFWVNRRAEVSPHNGASRAELRLLRTGEPTEDDDNDGVIWIERRHRFLGREFLPGERIGRYTFAYVRTAGAE